MRAVWAALAVTALAVSGWTQSVPPASAVFRADFSNPATSPSRWTLALHPDGRGHFRSVMGPDPASAEEMVVPDVDRDIQVSTGFAERVFQIAQRHKYFNAPCDSGLKVAFQGWKTFSYSGPDGNGSCRFNYSKDKQIQDLEYSLEAVVQTILEGERLKMYLEHDRLGLDQEMGFLLDAAKDGRAQQICTIRSILKRLAGDPDVMERVRKGARDLLARAD